MTAGRDARSSSQSDGVGEVLADGPADVPADVAALAVLGDPVRHRFYRYVADASVPVGREEAAAALGVANHVARFHLDRLLEAGLLEAEYRRPPGRGGPGAGRPTKLYRPSSPEVVASVPPRRYDLVADVLTRAVADVLRDGTPLEEALSQAASTVGRALGTGSAGSAASTARAVGALRSCGFDPTPDGDTIVLGNCPFRALATFEPGLICGLNLMLIRGVLDGVGASIDTARLDPAEGRCCVTVDA